MSFGLCCVFLFGLIKGFKVRQRELGLLNLILGFVLNVVEIDFKMSEKWAFPFIFNYVFYHNNNKSLIY